MKLIIYINNISNTMLRYFRRFLSSNDYTIHRTISGIDTSHLQSKGYLYQNFIKFTPIEKITLTWGPAMASSVDPRNLKKHHLSQTPYRLYVHSKENNHQPASQKN